MPKTLSLFAFFLVGVLVTACGSSGPSPELTALTGKVTALEQSLASSQGKITALEQSLASSQEEVALLKACGEATSPAEFCGVDAAQAKNIMASRNAVLALDKALKKSITDFQKADQSIIVNSQKRPKVNTDAIDSLIPAINDLCRFFSRTPGCVSFAEAQSK